jgi:hypothetical protein
VVVGAGRTREYFSGSWSSSVLAASQFFASGANQEFVRLVDMT